MLGEKTKGLRLFKGKKGSLDDLVMIAVVLLVFSIVIIITYKINDELNIEFQANTDIDSKGKATFQQINNLYPGVIDNSFLFLTVALSIGAIALAAMVRVHPIFLALFFIMWFIVIFLSAVFSNIYQTIVAEAELATLAAELTFVNQIMNTLPWLIAIFGGVLALLMYKQFKMEQDYY